MPSLRPLANRQTDPASPFQLPSDGWYQIAPAGEFIVQAAPADPLVQVLDEAAFAAMVDSFAQVAAAADFAGLLVDYDHFSMDLDKASEAAGWITDLALRDGTLWGRIRWSERGAQAVVGGSYRFLSPVFDRASAEPLGGTRLRPTRLLNAGLTNDPNLKGIRPLSNRHSGTMPHSQEAARMKQQLAEILELGPDAPDQEFVDRIQELRNRATQAQANEEELLRLRGEEAENRVKADLEEHKDKIADPLKAKEALLANREAAIGILAAVRPPTPSSSLPNRRTATIPATDPGDTALDPSAQSHAVAIRNRAAQIQTEQGVNYTTAWNLAQTELG